tara:strand:- start:2077 stop:2571 length:495 start_codon:yes stop_codon:yes gene_type:complete
VALIRGLVYSLVENGRIKTTLAKAKEVRRHVEKAVTLGKKGTLHSRRLLESRYPNPGVVQTLVTDLKDRFADRAGGYTRIIKIGHRDGDSAPVAFIEFVDYKPSTGATADEPKAAKKASAKKTASKKASAAKKVTKKASAEKSKKKTRKKQSTARKTSRTKKKA